QYVRNDHMISREELFRYFGRLQINKYGITGKMNEAIGTAIYLGLSVLDHSCLPDLEYRFIRSTMILRSQKEGQKYSDNLLVSYMPHLLTTEERRERLREYYFFECNCVRCKDKEEDGYARSMECSSCKDGICPLYDDSTTLSCAQCHAVSSITPDKAYRLNAEILPGMDFGTKDITTVYEDKSKVLSRRNTQLALLASRLVVQHMNNPSLSAKYESLCEETLTSSIPLGVTDLTVILGNLTVAAKKREPSSANTRRLCAKLRSAILASHGTEKTARSRDDPYAVYIYDIITGIENKNRKK
ncbi:hypothetical protein PENTCL1PPCAC_26554, partial [Pristionchus entomophagus]